jgi:hypothetical protein
MSTFMRFYFSSLLSSRAFRFGACHGRMSQPVLTCASIVVQLVTSAGGELDGGIRWHYVSRYKCCVYSFKNVGKKREKYRRSIWVKDYLKSRNSRLMRDLELNEDVLLKNLTRMSKTNFIRFRGLWRQRLQNGILLLLYSVLFSTPFSIFKACAIACVTFVKRMRHTTVR